MHSAVKYFSLTKKEVKSFILVNYRMKKMSDEQVMSLSNEFVPKCSSVAGASLDMGAPGRQKGAKGGAKGSGPRGTYCTEC